MPNSLIVALLTDEHEMSTLARGLHGAHVTFCETSQDLCAALTRSDTKAVITELRDSRGVSVRPALAGSRHLFPNRPVIIHTSLTQRTIRDLLDLSMADLRIATTVPGWDDLAAVALDVKELSRSLGSQARIIATLTSLLGPSIPQELAASVWLGTRRCTVPAFANFLSSSQRTIERRLELARLPSASVLLGSWLVLHAAWRMDFLQWGTKQVSTAAGFDSANSFGLYLKRRTGLCVTELRARGFDWLLEQLSRRLRRGDAQENLATTSSADSQFDGVFVEH